ncbi:autotransporter outer membrane beta-barrel domain-containing protein [Salmonella enterica subsp. enterica serovar Oranienburg]|uniref:Autotransporter outer membrane beta-barrel domain-containing protein n=1 Tax=Salmonella enterica I TaxID=59201 RepID=A0A3R0XUJ0_SALET|nr:autotransporter outer membrane beta-barrel domain-containing protein [Salmonella enterica subsp. enterica serovar Oranienburg]EED9398057.1 autotransporter outer membrane beta-barrel domain-containing protein [Salmonella enterica subsp. enterica serovar Oranienburg]MLV00060.1 autotransporter outer membrane beta-barrel domain-containing protein [Salmonella enterica subsp. enterica serovar Oranienburg]
MAVENKFKLNVIAASVLMGLSMSVVAADMPVPPKTEVSATSPVATLADKAGKADISKINVSVASISKPLSEVLQGVNGYGLGSGEADNSKKKAYDDAVTKMGEAQIKYDGLSADKKEQIGTYEASKTTLNNAESGLNDFITKANGVNNVYNEKLKALYGSAAGEFVIDESGKTIATNTAKDTAFSKYRESVTDNKVGLTATLKALNTLANTDAGDTAAAQSVKDAHAAITSLLNYIGNSEKVAQDNRMLAASESYISEKLPAFLLVVERHKDEALNQGTDKDKKLREHYADYLSAVDTFRKDKTDKNKTAVYTALSQLVIDVNAAGSAATSINSDSEKTAVAAFKTSLDAVKSITDTTKASLTTDSAAIKDGVTVGGTKITTEQDAVNALKTAFGTLVDAAKAADKTAPTKTKALQDKIDAATDAYKQFTSARDVFNSLHKELTEVGDARLALSTEWQTVNQSYADAWKKYNEARNDYSKITEAGTLDSEKDAVASKRGDYIASLSTTSDAVKDAIGKAKSEYVAALAKAGATVTDKNKALYTLIGVEKALVPVKLGMDKEALELAESGYVSGGKATPDLKALQASLTDAEKGKPDAVNAYNAAVTDYLKAEADYKASKSVSDEVALSVAGEKLKHAAGVTDLTTLYYKSGDAHSGFVTFDNLPSTSTVAGKTGTAMAALFNKDSPTDIQKKRQAVAEGLRDVASLMPLSTTQEQKDLRAAYLSALKTVSVSSVPTDEQSKVPGAESITHILGSLSASDISSYDFAAGNYKSVIVNTDKDGNITGVKDNFTAKDLYTGTKDKPFTTTVLDIRALELGNGKLADTNTITVGEAGSKATPVEVWAKTAGVKHSTKDENSKYESAENGPAVILSGDLRTATAQLDENGKPMDGQVVRGADQIHLQNVNIHNSFTLADRTKMLADDMAAITSEAADKLKLGQPADGNDGVDVWQKTQTDLLNSKYDKLNLTGLQIATTTVNPEFDVDNGVWTTAAKTVIPTDPNILLDNLNITLQNDSVGGTSTAISLSKTGNHILANGGVFDAGKAGNLAEANVLDITGADNLVEFRGSTLKGDIRSDATGNTVNLTNGSLLAGNAIAVTGNLHLNLDNSTWNGGVGPNSPDVSLSNNSVWNVKGYHASVNALSLSGSNSINLINSDGLAQLGGHGFTGEKSAVILSVDTDLTSDGKGVTSVLAGTYSPDSLHSLTGTGLADNYQFGTLHVNGLATGGKYALSVESAGAEPYTIGGRLADGADGTSAHAFVSYKTSESRVVTGQDGKPVSQNVTSDADFTSLSAPAELGVYQYAAEKVMDGVNNRTNIYYRSTGQLSNSAATVVSLAAAPVDVANLESDTLAKHMNSVRHGKDSGVWVSYFGGENRNSTASGPEYKLKTNGVMLGADTLTENNWLAGVAVSSARSDMSVMNSSGDLNSYGAQFYMSRRYDSGVFVDSALQFNHFSNTAKARMINGQQAKADFSGNSYGLEAKVGYAWNSEGFFAEPYVRAAARAFDGEHYALSNGMTVNSNDYKSMLGEVGADLGYQYAISGGYVKPYLHLAALNEFADGNSVRVNNVTLDDSVKGAAFQAGLGAEVKVTDNLGGYAAFDYTKGDNTERPWQATVGVNYTW